jgi:hypothetical protein
MIIIPNWDGQFEGKSFKDKNDRDTSRTYSAVGYGDNDGARYIIGSYVENGKTYLSTVLLKDVVLS